jgi:putative oxidoreductase
MNKLTLIARILMGLIFFVFGLNGFFHFIPMPAPQGPSVVFFYGMIATVYFFPLLAGTQTVCGVLLLSGAMVPLALIVLAPVILNIFLFHAFIDRSGLPLAIVLGVLEIHLSFFSAQYSPIVKQIFRCPLMEAKN